MVKLTRFSAQKLSIDSINIIRLIDKKKNIYSSILPGVGNIAYELCVNNKNLLWMPFKDLNEFLLKPQLCGIPFLAPWANRIDQDAYYVGENKYLLNPSFNIWHDENGKPLHGLLMYSPYWKVISLKASESFGSVTSQLEFWRYPELMAQFPFAHTIEMQYILYDQGLEIKTQINNLSMQSMPLAIGYHPYFQLHHSSRYEWQVTINATDYLVLTKEKIPTGEQKPVVFPRPFPLAHSQLDDMFTNLIRDDKGLAKFSIKGKNEEISILYGPKYSATIIYAPTNYNFICLEPMSAITNAFNLAHEGKYPDLQYIQPNTLWQESFWIEFKNF